MRTPNTDVILYVQALKEGVRVSFWVFLLTKMNEFESGICMRKTPQDLQLNN